MGDLLSAISLILVFETVFLGMVHDKLGRISKIPRPSVDERTKRKENERMLRNVFWQRVLPVFLLILTSRYILLPKFVEVLCTSRFELWNFDPLRTLFLLVEIGVTFLLVIATYFLVWHHREAKRLK